MNGYALTAALALVTTLGVAHPTSSPPSGMMGRGMMGQGMMSQGMGPVMMGHGMMMGSMVRHHQAMMYGVPQPYSSAHNPLPGNATTLRRGAQVYDQNCSACHGPNGYGDGPSGQQLSPRPADLAWLARSHMVGDQYIYWTVAEGGQPVGSAMPAFKSVLSQRDIWAVVTYVRRGVGSHTR
jgi:mono/diheme cytochrome c family protein